MREQRCEGTSDTSLTKFGKVQATKIARAYSQKQIDGIISSRLHRATQCAKIIKQFIPLKINRDERLNDMCLGIWQGKFPEEIESRYPDISKQWKTDPAKAEIPEGDRFTEVQNRALEFIEDLYESSLFSKYYLVSTHDIIIRILLSSIQNTSLGKFWEYELSPGSVTEISICPEKKVLEINNTKHLYV